jgi:hypothetical protein
MPRRSTLISGTNTQAVENKIRRVFATRLRKRRLPPEFATWFEHNQWWLIHNPTGRTWSVVDAEPGVAHSGIDFELIAEGEEY